MVHVEETSDVSRLVRDSASGSAEAWSELVRRYAPLVMSVIRSYRLSPADAQDVSQTVWLRLVEHLSGLREPEALPGWLSTTARREALAVLRGQQRAIPSEDVADRVAPDDTDVASALMDDELRRALDEAVETLPPSQRLIVRALLREPASYDALSEELGIPRGSLGPLRGRAVRALRAQLEPSLR